MRLFRQDCGRAFPHGRPQIPKTSVVNRTLHSQCLFLPQMRHVWVNVLMVLTVERVAGALPGWAEVWEALELLLEKFCVLSCLLNLCDAATWTWQSLDLWGHTETVPSGSSQLSSSTKTRPSGARVHDTATASSGPQQCTIVSFSRALLRLCSPLIFCFTLLLLHTHVYISLRDHQNNSKDPEKKEEWGLTAMRLAAWLCRLSAPARLNILAKEPGALRFIRHVRSTQYGSLTTVDLPFAPSRQRQLPSLSPAEASNRYPNPLFRTLCKARTALGVSINQFRSSPATWVHHPLTISLSLRRSLRLIVPYSASPEPPAWAQARPCSLLCRVSGA